MARFGKPDATGRSSGKLTGHAGKLQRPPKNMPWSWLTRELLDSPAWGAMSINCRRLIDFLLIEHMNHAGRQNGVLKATYEQLVAFGLTRSEIFSAITEAELFGLIEVEHGGRWNRTNQPSTFRLTFYADREGNPPTNRWKAITDDMIPEIRMRLKARRKGKSMPRTRTTVVREVGLRALPGGAGQR